MSRHLQSTLYSGRSGTGYVVRGLLLTLLGSGLLGCGGAESPVSNTGGTFSVASGGAISLGGTSTVASGGSANAGSNASEGGTATGGNAVTGGTFSAASGGTMAFGGSDSGGTPPTGGSTFAGGASSTGNTSVTGGKAQTGGSSATSGTKTTGGVPATGGGIATGGNATGGNAGAGGSAGTDKCGRSTTIAVPSGYTKLTWHDEFDVDGAPSASNWGYETGFVRNNELQWYQSKNATVTGGLLTISGKREQVTNPNYNPNGADWKTTRQYAQYTAASMTTSGKQSWKFGRFELCGKIPISKGMWPAWWALGVSGEWPSNGEIDMMEYYNGKILANVATGTSTRWVAKWFSATKAVDATWSASYHLWRMDWDTNAIKLYVDDSLLNSVSLTDAVNADGTTPFRQNAYMIVNLAIGGDNGGDPSSTTFPQDYLIDYIRVFQ